MQQHFKTVLGEITEQDVGIALPHEHICCYSEYLYQMVGARYLDKDKLTICSVNYLKKLKEKYRLSTIIDCTPINIGRDVELLKNISEKSGVNIICATGFYYTEETILFNTPADVLSEYIVTDAINVNAGIIKCAVENENISPYNEKILRACAKAQLKLNIPIVMHTNANNQNGIRALDILLSEGVKPEAITVGHLSDTENFEYIKSIAKCRCFIGLDRHYGNYTNDYIQKKVEIIARLCEAGYDDKILVSHDELCFSGFDVNPKINPAPRFNYCFEYILPKLLGDIAEKLTTDNVMKMLKCEG